VSHRVYVTGGAGFVGSNLVRVLAELRGAELCCPSRSEVDVTDGEAVRRSVSDFRPDAVVHAAILNDFGRLYTHRREAWDAYVGATRNVVNAANAVDAHVVLVSTDWVFDGTQAGAREDTPPNPINAYGFLKAASELVLAERAESGAVARISGVNGVHWARPEVPRRQDAGFGYFALSIVAALETGRRFTVWESPDVNTIATPTLASDAAELIARLLDRRLTGIFHCCGSEAIERRALAERVVEVFELDRELLDFGPPGPDALPPGRVPYDTSLNAAATAAALGVELPGVRSMLGRLRWEDETGEIAPLPGAVVESA
jgi:dTDP-4-dehydrorhamnose reductase